MIEENKEIVIVDDKTIQEKIYFIRGQKVMLDADLAEIYGYETKSFNRCCHFLGCLTVIMSSVPVIRLYGLNVHVLNL